MGHSGNQCVLCCTSCGGFLTSATKCASRGAKCKTCENKRKREERKERQVRIQWKLIQEKGGHCTMCTLKVEKNTMICFDFHHLNPIEKEDTISNMLACSRPYALIKKEADKCILLCACCHRLIHQELDRTTD